MFIVIVVKRPKLLRCFQVTKFHQLLEHGSKACISEVYQTAVVHYRTALTLLGNHSDIQVFVKSFVFEMNTTLLYDTFAEVCIYSGYDL